MCGIAGGVWNHESKALSEQTLTRMLDSIRHRGPDDSGTYISKPSQATCALGHRRLSIIDLGGGHQPLCNEDGTVWIAFNGEIYNYRELREELLAKGHQFKTDSDTEVIVHLYEDLGEECLQRLQGMFAFAIWDQKQEKLFIARDRIGQKPLYYQFDGERFIFASELKALLQIPGIKREVDHEAIDLYLTYQYVPYPWTILKGFQKLPPGHSLTFSKKQLQVQRYWQPPYEPTEASPLPKLSVDQWKKQLRETLTEAVRLRMRSDVPIGSFLSGGVDSTIISGLMQSLSPHPIHTFSMGFPVKQFDERAYAREAAELLGTNHHEFVAEPSALETLSKLIWHYDEPFGDSSAIPTMYLSEVTRKIVTVALSGDGGDELFCGYPRYQGVDMAGKTDRLPMPIRSILAAKIWQKIPSSSRQRSFGRRLKRFISALGQSPELRYLRWIGTFDQDSRQQLYTSSFKKSLNGFDSSQFILSCYEECPSRDFLTRTTSADVVSYLTCDIMAKVDVASMCYSLEARSPFLDHNVVELAAQIPMELKYKNGLGKQILIETFSDLLPTSIQKRSKMGFGVPIDHWFRKELKPLVEETLLSDRFYDRGYFNRETIQTMVDAHMSGRWDHSYRMWNLICLEKWHQIFIDQDVPVMIL
ncbi:asparagine synthase (glutamine-hydrolyzing) [Planctomicrobium sp.]|jgi:asparagine synthase (glutamine-hydrolysing)|nr:asparagine synthase (glutamine-hydrolyzing) [Planctomicrobium sp.]MBT5021093.1 asparagine synthase (glutamine-hydrolyzing) [Planctomicrobium sp.]MDB4743043.1 asparagine synthase (glutamine-hydrolyzing) [Planctomicrobium sp.]